MQQQGENVLEQTHVWYKDFSQIYFIICESV